VLLEQPFAHQWTSLNIARGKIRGQKALPSMAAFTNLRELIISNNSIEDAGLRLLSELSFASNWAVLRIACTGITIEGLERYKNAFSNLKSLKVSYRFLHY